MQTLANIIVTTGVYALVAVGLTIIYGVLRVLHIAHAGVYAVGGYAAFEMFGRVPNFWIATAAAMAAAALVGLAIYWLLYRPLLDAPRSVPLLASIGTFIAIQALLQRPFLLGPDSYPMPATSGLPDLRLGALAFSSIQLTIIVVALVVVVAVTLLIRRTRLGLSWRAITGDRLMAASSGVNLDSSVAANFLIGSALAGLAAMLTIVYTNSISARIGEVVSYKAFVIVVLGGLGSVPGAVAASFLLAAAEILSTRYVGGLLPRDAIAFLVLIVVLLIRPEGLTGRRAAT
jgi:branched-chain amino acid transport system permease protein